MEISKRAHRGYEVSGNYFYVEEVCQTPQLFFSFDEYYSYVNHDIYTNACYLGWDPDPKLIKEYKIEKSKLNLTSFRKDTVADHVWILSEEISSIHRRTKDREKHLNNMLDMLTSCRTTEDIKSTFEYYLSEKYSSDDICIVLCVYLQTAKEGEALLCDSARDDCIPEALINVIISCCNDPISFSESFRKPTYAAKKILEYKKTALAYSSNNHMKGYRFAHYDIGGFFVILRAILADDGNGYRKLNAFKNFFDFVHSLENDLSNVDLSDCILDGIDFTKYKTNNHTKLPLPEKDPLIFHLKSGFENGCFFVNQEWTDSFGVARHSINNTFVHFVDFLHFIGNNLNGVDFSMMPLGIYDQIQKAGFDLSEAISPVPWEGIDDQLEFAIPAQNEMRTKSMLQLVRPGDITNVLTSSTSGNDGSQILYISDLHLDNFVKEATCHTKGDVYSLLQSIGRRLEKSYRDNSHAFTDALDIVLITGDIAHDERLFNMFVNMNFGFLYKAIIILGNHELWSYPGLTVEEIVERYRSTTPTSVIIVQNEIILFQDELYNLNSSQISHHSTKRITYEEAMALSPDELSNKMSEARVIMLAGTGFSSFSQKYNANNGIYRNTLSREQEIAESHKFDSLYNHFLLATKTLKERTIVVATHMPLDHWHPELKYEDNIIYISGHTHQNHFHDDGVQRIYADNQNGYHGRTPLFKSIGINDIYDPFVSYPDGIHKISKQEYILLCRAKKINMQLKREYDAIYMLKKCGYYCCAVRLASGKLGILNGGSVKSINARDIEFVYNKMDREIARLCRPLQLYTTLQEQLSDAVKSFGGLGRIHGCIIDIDYYNHIYLNPYDSSVTYYYALDIVNKRVYGSLSAMLEVRSPSLYQNYMRWLQSNENNVLTLFKSNQINTADPEGMEYLETDIYKASREISKIQRLHNNILTFWDDRLWNEGQNIIEHSN